MDKNKVADAPLCFNAACDLKETPNRRGGGHCNQNEDRMNGHTDMVRLGNTLCDSVVLLTAVLVIALIPRLGAQSAPDSTQEVPSANSAPTQAWSAAPKASAPAQPSPYTPGHFPKRAAMYYEGVWGIDSLVVRSTESGELIRFSYRVLDPARAKQLNEKKSEPSLIDPRAGVKLVVPSLEKVGQLRQSSTPEAGREYWMAFSNPRRTVKRGDRVSVVIGTFHADGLVVE